MTMQHIPQAKGLDNELIFSTSRSSGPGGQNVNKVNTKVTLRFDIGHSMILDEDQKELMIRRIANRITKEGILVLTAQDRRSQLQNKEAVLAKLDRLLTSIFSRPKVRKATKPGPAAKHKRRWEKEYRSEKKQWRQKP